MPAAVPRVWRSAIMSLGNGRRPRTTVVPMPQASSAHALPRGIPPVRGRTAVRRRVPGNARPGLRCHHRPRGIPHPSAVRRMKPLSVSASTARFEATSPAECPPLPSAATTGEAEGGIG